MMALILAVAMQQAATSEFRVTASVVRPACVEVSATGAVGWSERRRPGPDAVHCTRTSSAYLPPPRLARATRAVEGSERQTLEIDY